MKKDKVFVEVVRNDGKVVRRIGPLTPRKAQKVEDGIMINLDHEEFYTQIVEEEK